MLNRWASQALVAVQVLYNNNILIEPSKEEELDLTFLIEQSIEYMSKFKEYLERENKVVNDCYIVNRAPRWRNNTVELPLL